MGTNAPKESLAEAAAKYEYYEARLASDLTLWRIANRGDIAAADYHYYTQREINLVRNRNYWQAKWEELREAIN